MRIQLLSEQKFEVVCKLDGKTESAQDAIVLTGTEKECVKCGEVKSLEGFYKREKSKDVYRNQCKKCCNKRQIVWDKNNPEKVKAKDVKWKKNNPQKIKDYTAKRYAANSEREKAYAAKQRKANPEKVKAKNAVYRKSHREQAKAYTAAWRAANPNSGAEWKAKNPEKVKAKLHRYRARKLAAGGSFTGADIKAMMEQQGGRCVVCEIDITTSSHVDHIMPLALGGHNGIQNIQLLCQHCNCSKSAKHPIDWMQERGFLL